jgi:hypothetical protein
MRNWLFVLLAACGGPAAPTQPTQPTQPPPQPIVQKIAPAQPEMPKCDGYNVPCIVGQMEYFSNRMCACKDKACADGTNEAMTKWGTELAKQPPPQEKPDPALARKSADIMTRYTECMTKVMIGDPNAKPPANPCGDDPCGG